MERNCAKENPHQQALSCNINVQYDDKIEKAYLSGLKPKERYVIQDRLSAGPFGEVYSAVDAVTGENVIVKRSHDEAMLQLEITVMKAVQRKEIEGFAQLKHYSLNQEASFIVMNRFGQTLQDIMDEKSTLFSIKTVMQIGIQLTTLLEKFHGLGLVYNDLKPDNICVGNLDSNGDLTNQHAIYLIDYGLASLYQKKDNYSSEMRHVNQKTEGFRGNYAYASQNALNLQTTSRRDDILSMLFLIYYLITGEVYGNPTIPSREAILQKRKNYDQNNLRDARELMDLMEYAYELQFQEKPNYNKIRFLFTKVLLDNEQVPSKDFDWNKSETINSKIKDLMELGLVKKEHQIKFGQLGCLDDNLRKNQSLEQGLKLIEQYKVQIIQNLNDDQRENYEDSEVPDESYLQEKSLINELPDTNSVPLINQVFQVDFNQNRKQKI